MGEPCLLTEKQYQSYWEQYAKTGKPYREGQMLIMRLLIVFIVGLIFGANAYGTGHSRNGSLLMIVFAGCFGLCLVASVIARVNSRRKFNIWAIYFPYDPERIYTVEYFKKADLSTVGKRRSIKNETKNNSEKTE